MYYSLEGAIHLLSAALLAPEPGGGSGFVAVPGGCYPERPAMLWGKTLRNEVAE